MLGKIVRRLVDGCEVLHTEKNFRELNQAARAYAGRLRCKWRCPTAYIGIMELAEVVDGQAGRQFDREAIILCVRWYLRYKLSLRDLGR
jgi:hypothetical protein